MITTKIAESCDEVGTLIYVVFYKDQGCDHF